MDGVLWVFLFENQPFYEPGEGTFAKSVGSIAIMLKK